MRIVEPVRYDHQKHGSRRLSRIVIVGCVLMSAAMLTIVAYLALSGSSQSQNTVADKQVATTQETSSEVPKDASESANQPQGDSPTTPSIRQFAPNDFKVFYDQLEQTGLTPVENPPPITGDVSADARIRIIAEARGYRLRKSPSAVLGTIDGFPMQSAVGPDWLALKAAAQAEGLSLSIVSAYRSAEHQRTLFLTRLNAAGATIEQVASGQADDKVNSVLVTSSIPGYSKHHTGYTLDFLCAGWQFENFKNSPCNAWISADNYAVAKRHGFIPSYPPGADAQGPDPEAWEYVWVGVESLIERKVTL